MVVKSFREASIDDKLVKISGYAIVIFMVAVTLYPFIYVFSSSISSPYAVLQNKVTLIPVGFDLTAYKKVIAYEMVWIGYRNTIFYTLAGMVFNMVATALMAYPLSRKGLPGKTFILLAIVLTMVFKPGLIPKYLVVRQLGMIDTVWSLLLPTLITTTNLMILKTFFQNIPESLVESAYIDGASELRILTKIIAPLSTPAIASVSLFYAVKHWNSYFEALIYINNDRLQPIQLFLRKIVLESQTLSIIGDSTGASVEQVILTESIKYATIVIVSLPIILVYPFIQKFFHKGVMIGAIKE